MAPVRTAIGLAIAAVALTAARAGALADPAPALSSGRAITIFVGADPGGTYDLYARTIARHLGDHLAGSPKVIVENMPGAGGFLAASHVFSVAPQDGTAIAALGSALPLQPLIDPNSPKLDVPRIKWLGSAATYNALMVVRSSLPVYSLDDLRKRQTIMATIAPGQLNSVIVAATDAALGAKIHGVNGHLGLGAAMLALERGEIDGYPTMPVDALERQYSGLLKADKIRIVLQYGPAPSPQFPNVPYALKFAPDPMSRNLLELAQAPLGLGYSYMLGPGVSDERVRTLRRAFDATLKDPALLQDAARQHLTIAPLDGETIRTRLQRIYATPADVVQRMRELYRSPP